MKTLNQLPVGCILLGENSLIRFMNQAAIDLYGYSLEESRGRHPGDLFVERGEREDLFTLLRETTDENIAVRVLECRTKDGELLKCKWQCSLFQDEGNNQRGVLITIDDISREKNTEERLNRQVRFLSSLRNIDIAISGSADLQTILHVVLREAMEQLKMSAAVVLIFDPSTHLLKFGAARGLRTKALESTMIHLGEGYAGRAALERRIVQIPTLNSKKTDFLRLPSFNQEEFKSYFCVPLISKGEIQGVLESFHRSTFVPDSEWLDFFEMLGGQAAIAIDSAKLFTNLQRSNLDLTLAYDTTLEGWSRALDLRDRDTEGHTRRVTELTERLAIALNVSAVERIHIRRGALLHDIGKMGVPDRILLKEEALTEEDWVIIRQHPVIALDLLKPISYLENCLDIPYCHHERWDGSGYPRGLKGDQIPLAARIFAVVDVFDALTSNRPYRRAWSSQRALEYLKAGRNKLFDPAILDVFVQIIEQGSSSQKDSASEGAAAIN